jgi:hypothetical protein
MIQDACKLIRDWKVSLSRVILHRKSARSPIRFLAAPCRQAMDVEFGAAQ